ncbi:uncharacterized protein CDV56_107751 [Aspergillus thermomutatus]|uniref:Uncharacterized protein n=1 Tax=Aspergillus thermomutatus TaxID=41047 RepID=A0A397I136_ASPTH|nr:uncharacterized protein CDV56_107751 [Aspergillus thermomutatus]RHZ67144.1 hypothetical protein CDV56_107751 [Aspergillus thermomutatus]
MDTSNISRQMIGFLLGKPKNWTSEHMRTLNVEEKGTISAAEMVGQKNLPDEGDQVFQGLLRQFMEPTKDDILNFRYNQFSHPENAFSAVFHETSYLTFPVPENHEPNSIPLSTIIHWMIIACYGLGEIWKECGPLPFHLPLFQVRGTLNCPGAIGRHPKGENSPFSPLVIYNFAKGSTEENKIKGEVPYGLFLIFVAFNTNPHRGEYASFVITMRRTSPTSVQITKLVASGSYLQTLCQGRPLEEHLKIYRSPEFDLVEPEGRKAFLVMFMGVVNYVMFSPD